MQFVYPAFLWALTALSIPIILHLFYFRRYKKVYFSNLRFLREVKEETSARHKLRNLLILLARLLAMAFIIFAFAQPIIPIGDAVHSGIRKVSLFVDNSFSMQSFGKDLSLFDKARQKAKEIILGYGTNDQFRIQGHELTAAQNQWLGRDEALVRLEEMDFTPDVKSLSVITGRQKQNHADDRAHFSGWILSDFQKTISNLSTTDTTLELNLLPLRGVQEKNVSIDTAWFESPVQTLHQSTVLLFRLHNYSEEDLDNIRVTVDLDGQERPEGTVDLRSGDSVIDTARITVLTTGWHELVIRISDFPVTFDDTYFLTFYVEENLKILSINQTEGNKQIGAVFADPKFFILDNALASQLQYARFPDYQLIILNELLQIPSGLISAIKRYVEEGGKVLFIPDEEGPLEQYNALMQAMAADALTTWEEKERQVGAINTDAFVFNDVFTRTRPNMRLPKVNGAFGISGAGRRGEPLLTYRDGGVFVNWYTPGAGAFCVLSSSLDETISDLTLQPEIFVPLLYKTAIYTSETKKISFTIGVDDLIPMDRHQLQMNENVIISGTSEFRPGLSALGSKILLDVQGQVQRAGFYKVMQQDQLVASLAFNYDRRESDLDVVPVADLPANEKIKVWNQGDAADFTELIQSTQQGKPLWKWCIILSLLFIATEIALIRLWKS